MKKTTSMVIVATIAGLILYDVFAIIQGGTEASISSVIIAFSYKMPMATFLSGFVCGHLFWRMRTNKDTKDIDKQE